MWQLLNALKRLLHSADEVRITSNNLAQCGILYRIQLFMVLPRQWSGSKTSFSLIQFQCIWQWLSLVSLNFLQYIVIQEFCRCWCNAGPICHTLKAIKLMKPSSWFCSSFEILRISSCSFSQSFYIRLNCQVTKVSLNATACIGTCNAGCVSCIQRNMQVTRALVLSCCWLGSRKRIQPVKTEWWDAGVVICLGQGADLHMAQLMPLPLTISCSSKSRLVLPSWFYLSGADSPR